MLLLLNYFEFIIISMTNEMKENKIEFLHWAVIAKTTSKNNELEETVEHIEALFTYPNLAQDFIDKCLHGVITVVIIEGISLMCRSGAACFGKLLFAVFLRFFLQFVRSCLVNIIIEPISIEVITM